MMGGAKAHYDGIVAFSQTDFTEDLKKIIIPVLVMHSEDDQSSPMLPPGRSPRSCAERNLKNLQGLPARHAHHACRNDQCGSPGLPQGLKVLVECGRPRGLGRPIFE